MQRIGWYSRPFLTMISPPLVAIANVRHRSRPRQSTVNGDDLNCRISSTCIQEGGRFVPSSRSSLSRSWPRHANHEASSSPNISLITHAKLKWRKLPSLVIGSLSPTFSLRGAYYLIDIVVVEERAEEGIVHPRRGSI